MFLDYPRSIKIKEITIKLKKSKKKIKKGFQPIFTDTDTLPHL